MKCKIVSYLPCFIILALAVAVELHNNVNNTQGCRFDPWPCAWMEQCLKNVQVYLLPLYQGCTLQQSLSLLIKLPKLIIY